MSDKTRKALNIKEFAKLAGVSTATVSRVFSRDPKVTEATSTRVRELAEEHHFRPNQVAKSSFNGKTRSIGVLLCSLNTSYFADIALGIQQVLLPKDYLPIIVSLRGDADLVSLRRLVDHRVDGIIACIADQSFTNEELREIEIYQLPVVTIDAFAQKLFSDNISSDEEKCGRLAAEYFLKQGHRNIGFVYCSVHDVEKMPRYISFRGALFKAGVEITPDKLYNHNAPLGEWLSRQSRPFACYCYNDLDAVKLREAAAALGWSVPEDLSIIGTADLNFAAMMSPPLTTIRQNGCEIGELAAELILKRLAGDTSTHYKVTSDVSLVERGSVSRKNQ